MPRETLIVTKKIRGVLRRVGRQIKVARISRGLTIVRLATDLNITPARIRRAEAGDPGVMIGAYAMILSRFGIEEQLWALAAPEKESTARTDSNKGGSRGLE